MDHQGHWRTAQTVTFHEWVIIDTYWHSSNSHLPWMDHHRHLLTQLKQSPPMNGSSGTLTHSSVTFHEWVIIDTYWHSSNSHLPWMGHHRHLLTRGVTIRLATIRYISRYTTHDMVHDTIQNQLIYYQWKILKHCGMCHQYCYIKTVILARNSEFKINKDVHNHPCPKYLLLTNCVCKQNNKIS